ncbi:peptidyl-prolyl cis-trans isomerase FKBP20-1-like isoform X1 [Hibiscus syriacus]|uniref:Peptidyl-prolyl cis-trans isomerase FKBP20-1-like isoform X1 n=1 Tax=Hibiscus syriacus TaxID=106335 RepID=A0A6A2X301_HIBSY|nr:uncharacterized protein LOC120176519 [Hibiscus syriacus]KAE8669282.1 peptidyl-prolyl cis-trans isomerase FKBP20-1-like isoform X1 [Hibiscus syriacus]
MDSSSSTTAQPRSFYLDEKWKLSKRESLSSSSYSSSFTARSRQRCAFTRKCAKFVKKQRARFYIMRRCVAMLVCWRDFADS